MKTVYLVRHGQTQSNIREHIKDHTDPLSEEGVRQAHTVAERLSNLAIEKLYASNYLRAQQTAEIIATTCNLELETSSLFREEKPPSRLVGMSENEGDGYYYSQHYIDNANDPDLRFEDGENAADTHQRIIRALSELERCPEDRIAVVTHGNFLKPFVAHILLNQTGSTQDVFQMMRILKTTNTGVTEVFLQGERWRLRVWNDHAHFAE